MVLVGHDEQEKKAKDVKEALHSSHGFLQMFTVRGTVR